MPRPGKPTITPNRQTLAVGLGLILLGTIVAIRLPETPVGAITDDAYYVEMARSIAEGLGPVVKTGPDLPAANPDIFPSGFPYLLSPLARLFPESLGVLKLLPLGSTLLLLPLCLWLPGAGADNRLRLMVAALVMFNPWVIAWSVRILSDNVFAALSLGTLLWFLRLQRQQTLSRREWFGLVVLCAVAISVRTIGWALVLAISTFLLLQRRWAWALVQPAAVVALLVPIGFLLPGGSGLLTQGYAAQMWGARSAGVLRFALDNILHYVAELPVIMVPVFGAPIAGAMDQWGMGMLYPAAAYITGTVLLLFAGLAVIRNWSTPRVRLFTLYLGFYGAALANFDGYPSGVQTRLLIPVLPILIWLVLSGIARLAQTSARRWTGLVFGLLIVASLAHNGWRMVHPLRTSVAADGSGFVDPGEGSTWVLAHTEPDAIIMVQDTLQRHIHLRRPVVAFAQPISPATLAASVQSHGVKFILIGPVVHHHPHRLDAKGQAMLELIQTQPALYQPVHTDPARGIFIFACAD